MNCILLSLDFFRLYFSSFMKAQNSVTCNCVLSEPDKAALVGAVAARTDYISPPVGAEARSFAIVVPTIAW